MNDNKKLAREFVSKVRDLALEYDLPFFIVTNSASATCNNGCEAVRVARDNHIKYELSIGADPYEDWSKDSAISSSRAESVNLKGDKNQNSNKEN